MASDRQNSCSRALFKGVFQVNAGSQVVILADTAMRAHDIDEAAALAAKQRAEEALADKSTKIDQAQALAELAQAAAQLKLLEKLRKSTRS